MSVVTSSSSSAFPSPSSEQRRLEERYKEPTLEEVLEDEISLRLFTQFEEEGYRAENISFYCMVKNFENITSVEKEEDKEMKIHIIDTILTNFFIPNSPMELNIDFFLKDKYLKKTNPDELMDSGVWNEVLGVAISLMRTNSFVKFKKSSYWSLLMGVSHKNIFFNQDNFNLDLSYIGGKEIIAMAFPMEGFGASYRNPIHKVQAFFRYYHGKNYKVYNLCAEKMSTENSFVHMGYFPCNENAPPPFLTLVECVEDAKNFLEGNDNSNSSSNNINSNSSSSSSSGSRSSVFSSSRSSIFGSSSRGSIFSSNRNLCGSVVGSSSSSANSVSNISNSNSSSSSSNHNRNVSEINNKSTSNNNENANRVVAFHCMTGKGRTGVIVCCLLLRKNVVQDTESALNLFGNQRTLNNKAVTIPSQQRYIRYYEKYLKLSTSKKNNSSNHARLASVSSAVTTTTTSSSPPPPPLPLAASASLSAPSPAFVIDSPPISITSFVLTGCPFFGEEGGCDPYFKIFNFAGQKIYDSRKFTKVVAWQNNNNNNNGAIGSVIGSSNSSSSSCSSSSNSFHNRSSSGASSSSNHNRSGSKTDNSMKSSNNKSSRNIFNTSSTRNIFSQNNMNNNNNIENHDNNVFEMKCDFAVEGDFCVKFFDQDSQNKKDGCMFSFCLHTFFIRRSSYILTKKNLDRAHLDKKHIVFPADFTCEIVFEFPDLTKEEKDENNKLFAPIKMKKTEEKEENEESSEDEEDISEKPQRRAIEKKNKINTVLKNLVSKKKKRYQEYGFDLDLTYIHEKKIIAMGFPAKGREGMYRNAMTDVQRFFTKVHGNDAVRVYNLCSERKYAIDSFCSQVSFPHPDHGPPPFKMLVDFCIDARTFMEENENSVLAVHCKAGKGRTGCAIASLLCMKECASAEEALNVFGKARTRNNKGVTIPSQQRYVFYFAKFWLKHSQKLFFADEKKITNFNVENIYPARIIKSFKMTHAPNFDVGGGCDPYFKLYIHGRKKSIFDLRKSQKVLEWRKEISREIKCSIPIQGDVKIVFFDEDAVGKNDTMFWLWLNTFFIKKKHYVFKKENLDGASKDTHHKQFDKNFLFEIFFEEFPDMQEEEEEEVKEKEIVREKENEKVQEKEGEKTQVDIFHGVVGKEEKEEKGRKGEEAEEDDRYIDENNSIFRPEVVEGEESEEEEEEDLEAEGGFFFPSFASKKKKKKDQDGGEGEGKEIALGDKKALVMTSIEGKFRQCVEVRDRNFMLKKYRQCFVGKDTVTGLVARGYCPDRESAVEFGNVVMQMDVFSHVTKEHTFKDDNLFYRFNSTRRLLGLHQQFWNVRGSFKVASLELGTHMSIIEIPGGKYVIIDTITLDAEAKQALDTLTDRGKHIAAVLCVHPLHSMALSAFYHFYPKAKYYGCPRHLEKFKNIPWAGSLQHAAVRNQWEPHISVSAPDGIDFEEGTRVSTLLVFHRESGIVHVDDLFQYFVNPPLVLRMAGFKPGVLHFHNKLMSVPYLTDPIAFKEWLERILKEWDIQTICAAHGNNKVGGAKQAIATLLRESEDKLIKLARELTGQDIRASRANTVCLDCQDCG